MPNAERIAELQRLAFGAGASDDERHAAADELEALRRRSAASTAAHGAEGAGREPGPLDDSTGEDEESPGAPDAGATDAPAVVPGGRPARLVVGVATAALLAGIGVGWGWGAISASGIASDSGEPALRVPARDEGTLPAEAGNGTEADVEMPDPVPASEAPAMAVFDREQTEADRTPMAGGDDPMFDPLTQRRLVTFADGAIFSAALDEAGGICLAFDRPDGGGASMCTGETSFPPDGMHFDSTFDSRVQYQLRWYASGEIHVLRTPAG